MKFSGSAVVWPSGSSEKRLVSISGSGNATMVSISVLPSLMNSNRAATSCGLMRNSSAAMRMASECVSTRPPAPSSAELSSALAHDGRSSRRIRSGENWFIARCADKERPWLSNNPPDHFLPRRCRGRKYPVGHCHSVKHAVGRLLDVARREIDEKQVGSIAHPAIAWRWDFEPKRRDIVVEV